LSDEIGECSTLLTIAEASDSTTFRVFGSAPPSDESAFSTSASRISSNFFRRETMVGVTCCDSSQRRKASTSAATMTSAFSASRCRSSRFVSITLFRSSMS